MKVLMLIPALGPVYGGPSKCVVELTEALGKTGVEIDLVTTNANGHEVLDVPLMTWIVEKYYRLQYFPYWHITDYKFSLSLTQWLFQNIKNYDLVHTNAIFSYPNLPAYWACQHSKIPYIVTPMGMLEPWALAYKAKKKNLYFKLLEKPALEKANCIQMLASTEAKKAEFLAIKTPISIIPNGVHLENFSPLTEAEIFYQQFPHTRGKTLVIFLGRIDPKKGLDLLAPAFAQAQKQFPHLHLIIAGPDNTNFLTTAENYFVEANCREFVTFTGMLTGKLKYAVLSAAQIYVAPSYSEGFSISVLEGMASGLPCIITTGCNFPEAAENQAALIIDIDVQQLTGALLNLLENPEKAKQMGQQARQFILENYTWEKVALNLKNTYQDMLVCSSLN